MNALLAALAAFTGRPQPVLSRAWIVSAIGGLAALLVHYNGGTVAGWLNLNANDLAGVILFILPTVSGFLARRKVTPLAHPKAADGTPLTLSAPLAVLTTSAETVARPSVASNPALPALPPLPTMTDVLPPHPADVAPPA